MARVAILDSELLDHDLLNVLLDPLQKSLSLINSSFKSRLEPELTLLLRATLYKLSVWDSAASYGAKLQDLRYVLNRPTSSGSSSRIPKRILWIHGVLNLLIPYFHARTRAHALSHAWPDAPSNDSRRRAWEVLSMAESFTVSLALLNFVAFLWTGKYRTFVDRMLGMALVPSSKIVSRDVSYEFMNRQMVWHAFTEFLLFALPLVNARTIRRQLSHALSRLTLSSAFPILPFGLSSKGVTSNTDRPTRGPYWLLPQDQCAICAENSSYALNSLSSPDGVLNPSPYSPDAHGANILPPEATDSLDPENEPPNSISNPYIASCGHTYCYHCLAERMLRAAEEDTQWTCLRCAAPINGAERMTPVVDFDEGSDMISMGSDFDFTSNGSDIEDSIGSYSESGVSEDQ